MNAFFIKSRLSALIGFLASLFCACSPLLAPIAAPAWINSRIPVPEETGTSRFATRIDGQMKYLKDNLERQMACCGSNSICRTILIREGSLLWSRSSGVYSLVHTNVPIIEKKIALEKNYVAINSLKVCEKIVPVTTYPVKPKN